MIRNVKRQLIIQEGGGKESLHQLPAVAGIGYHPWILPVIPARGPEPGITITAILQRVRQDRQCARKILPERIVKRLVVCTVIPVQVQTHLQTFRHIHRSIRPNGILLLLVIRSNDHPAPGEITQGEPVLIFIRAARNAQIMLLYRTLVKGDVKPVAGRISVRIGLHSILRVEERYYDMLEQPDMAA